MLSVKPASLDNRVGAKAFRATGVESALTGKPLDDEQTITLAAAHACGWHRSQRDLYASRLSGTSGADTTARAIRRTISMENDQSSNDQCQFFSLPFKDSFSARKGSL